MRPKLKLPSPVSPLTLPALCTKASNQSQRGKDGVNEAGAGAESSGGNGPGVLAGAPWPVRAPITSLKAMRQGRGRARDLLSDPSWHLGKALASLWLRTDAQHQPSGSRGPFQPHSGADETEVNRGVSKGNNI